jgi:hypothetical protein
MNEHFQPKIVIDPFSLLVVNRSGTLRRLYCPFWVKYINSDQRLDYGKFYLVDMVKSDFNFPIKYIIRGVAYSYYNFEVTIV